LIFQNNFSWYKLKELPHTATTPLVYSSAIPAAFVCRAQTGHCSKLVEFVQQNQIRIIFVKLNWTINANIPAHRMISKTTGFRPANGAPIVFRTYSFKAA